MPRRRARRAPSHRDGTTEQRILTAAHTVFLRSGTSGARMQDIAKEAEVNSALLHYYFKNKARLAEAVFQQTARELFPSIIGVMGSDLALDEKVVRVIQLEFDHLSRAPYLPTYVISELAHHPERLRQLVAAFAGRAPEDAGRHVLATLRTQIDARVRAGSLHPIEPDQFLVNLISLCVFPFAAKPMLRVVLGIDEEGFREFVDRRRTGLAAFFLRGLRP